jgi:hypothetical protein
MSMLASEPAVVEKRAYRRVPVAIAGQIFFPKTDVEHDCIVTDISLGGAKLQCAAQLETGTEVVLYMPGFDRFSGVIVRNEAEEAAMRFDCSDDKRERTAEKIMLHIAGILSDDTQTRLAERLAVPAPRSFTRPCGEVVPFELRDISLSGASLRTAARPPIGEIVTVGDTTGRITRHAEDGIALEFVRRG